MEANTFAILNYLENSPCTRWKNTQIKIVLFCLVAINSRCRNALWPFARNVTAGVVLG